MLRGVITVSVATIKLRRSDYAEKIIYLDGKPISFDAVPFMRSMLNSTAEKEVYQTGRQVGKSTTISSDIIVDTTANNFWRSLYVAPRDKQINEFSKDKLTSMLRQSPRINDFYVDHSTQNQTLAKEFLNGSRIVLRSCYHTADGARGISSNALYVDEIQDIIMENLPVLEEVTARKEPRKIRYAGTPKTFDNPIALLWDESTQNYWAVKCKLCNHWNVPLDASNISDDFLCCSKCKRQLHQHEGLYVSKYPGKAIVGWHVSQLMLYGAEGTGLPWDRVTAKVKDPLYSVAKLHNECLGFSYDVGSKLITESQLRACTNPDIDFFSIDRRDDWGIQVLVAGVDWGVLGGNTHTVLVLGGLNARGKLQVIYAKKFPMDQDPFDQVEEIADIVNRSGARILAADRGGGHHANSHLRNKLTWTKVHEIEYHPKVTKGMYFNDKSRTWITDRTRALAGIIIDIKTQAIEFPAWGVMGSTMFPDLLTLTCKYNEGNRAYQVLRGKGQTDDFSHALCYLRLAAKKLLTKPQAKEHQLEDFDPPDKEIVVGADVGDDTEEQ